jgi:DNA invertase Pin-like site-specific DNA recombinase
MKKYGYIGILEAEYSSLYRQQENAFHGSEQEEELRPFCDELVFEKNFRKKVDMDIDRLIQKLKQGDTIVICNLVFLARGIKPLLERLQRIEAKGITLEVLSIKGSSLATHAKAISEFNNFIAGSNISRAKREKNFEKSGNIHAAHNRSAIKSWRIQHQIKVESVTENKTVIELAKKYEVSRQVIYRILKKEEFKNVTEHLPRNYKLWDFEECKKRVRINPPKIHNGVIEIIFTLSGAMTIYTYRTKERKPSGKRLDEFLAKTDEELREIFTNATGVKYPSTTEEENNE